MATTELVSAFLKENYYSIAITVFVASLVYLLVFDEKEEVIKPSSEDKGEEQIPRVVSETAKKIEAEEEAAKVVAAEKEEQDFLQEQRDKMKQSAAPEVPRPPQEEAAPVTSSSNSSDTSVLAPFLAVPNALVYGITLGNVNLMEQSSPQTTPVKA